MEGASTLELLAELAIGVLGFSGIVAAIGQRGSGEWVPMDRSRFFVMVFSGALVIILALLPFPLHYAGLEVASLWSWSSGVGAWYTMDAGPHVKVLTNTEHAETVSNALRSVDGVTTTMISETTAALRTEESRSPRAAPRSGGTEIRVPRSPSSRADDQSTFCTRSPRYAWSACWSRSSGS